MTPYQLNLIIEENTNRAELRQKENIYQAFLISRWVWQKRINIEKILGVKKKEMSDKQLLESVKVLNQAFGGEVKIVEQ